MRMPIDQEKFGRMLFLQTAPATEQDGMTQKRNQRTNLPLWRVTVARLPEPGATGAAGTLVVKVASAAKPDLTPGGEVEFDSLVASDWQMNGRAGVSFSADAVAEV